MRNWPVCLKLVWASTFSDAIEQKKMRPLSLCFPVSQIAASLRIFAFYSVMRPSIYWVWLRCKLPRVCVLSKGCHLAPNKTQLIWKTEFPSWPSFVKPKSEAEYGRSKRNQELHIVTFFFVWAGLWREWGLLWIFHFRDPGSIWWLKRARQPGTSYLMSMCSKQGTMNSK